MAVRRPNATTMLQWLDRPEPDQQSVLQLTSREGIKTTVDPDGRLLLTVQEAAKRLSLGRSLMCELIRNGQVASVHGGRLRRISPDALSTMSPRSTTEAATMNPHDPPHAGSGHRPTRSGRSVIRPTFGLLGPRQSDQTHALATIGSPPGCRCP